MIKIPNVADAGYPTGVLLCPNCNDEYVHHTKIEVFERSEDAKTGTYVYVDYPHVVVDTKHALAGNPSTRRHGITIHVWCEMCHHEGKIHIAQHKGTTYLSSEVGAYSGGEDVR